MPYTRIVLPKAAVCAALLSLVCLVSIGPSALHAQRPASAPSTPASTELVAVDQRLTVSLNGEWHYILDPYLNGGGSGRSGYPMDEELPAGSNKLLEYSFAKSPTIKVPGDWNTQRVSLLNYEGGFWYERHFQYQPQAGHRAFLHIGAANYRSRVWVNGQLLCAHEGGFTPFDCEATKAVKAGSNSVVIFVDSTRIADGVPTLKTDWYNYGGLTRDVSLVTVPDSFIDDFDLHLDRATRNVIEGYVHVEGAQAGTPVTVDLPAAKLHAEGVTDADGRVAISMAAAGLTLWSPETPKLYHVVLKAGADTLTDEMGFRTIETLGTKILLNGKPIVLHGVCIHAEAPFRSGRVNNDRDVATLLGWVKELGGNFVRLAHYPHDQRMTRAADKLGILVWSEVPVYWAVQFEKEDVFAKSQQQLHEEIRRDRDKASVILWSIANETPNNAARTAFLTRSAEFVHQEDPTRLVTAALLVRGDAKTKYIDDPLGKALDVIGFNEYIGWYEGTPEAADATEWKIAYDKPLITSEFGGGAKAGLHGAKDRRWTEEYQAEIYRHQIGMLNKIPQLRGTTPWILMDFRSPVRELPGIQDGFNRKGLVSDQGKKKAAFFVLQKAYKENGLGHAE
ncbi:MAG: glycoside hydrolase family 2 TIM barrel-domain containing protein [Acidobacteriaceae bacterium]